MKTFFSAPKAAVADFTGPSHEPWRTPIELSSSDSTSPALTNALTRINGFDQQSWQRLNRRPRVKPARRAWVHPVSLQPQEWRVKSAAYRTSQLRPVRLRTIRIDAQFSLLCVAARVRAPLLSPLIARKRFVSMVGRLNDEFPARTSQVGTWSW